MPAKLTTEQWIEKAKAVHGDKYDYSKVVYKNNNTKVTIICPEHGEFEQRPAVHLKGHGCKMCGIDKATSNVDYKKRAETRRQTFVDKYGVENPMHIDDVKKKIKNTCLVRYGVTNPRQLQSVVDKARETNLKRYGAISYAKSEKGLARIQKTTEMRYGTSNFMQSEAAKDIIPAMIEKSKQTQIRKYGSDHYMKSARGQEMIAEYKSREILSKKSNGTLNTSSVEDIMYEMLVDHFGKSDVERNYTDERYPFCCDFYIKSKDMFIEMNIHWTHGHHWYNAENDKDVDVLKNWQQRAVDNEYYRNAVDVWIHRDVEKRKAAEKALLNYVVFWDDRMRDVELWFAMGCPCSSDYGYMYLWLPHRTLGQEDQKDTSDSISKIARYYQHDVFYEREIALWNDENQFRTGITLQLYLYYNRYKYIGKLPAELSDDEILRSFKISGAYRSYTVFDTSLFDKVVTKYDITSVYDPCAGWGERLLYCHEHDIFYGGVDVNDKLSRGYCRMIADKNMKKQFFQVADSSDVKAYWKTDAVITCPPYGNIEIYSDKGAENLSEPDFLKWWDKVVKNCSDIKYFCFQINQKYRTAMTKIVEKNGYIKIDEFVYDNNKSSHFTRKNGVNTKKEYEIMLVFEKG